MNSSSLISFHIIREEKCKKSKQLSFKDKVKRNGEIRNGETFRIFPFLGFRFGGQSDRKLNVRRECKVLYKEEGRVY